MGEGERARRRTVARRPLIDVDVTGGRIRGRADAGDHSGPHGTLGAEYYGVQRQVLLVASLISALVLATIVLMVMHVRG